MIAFGACREVEVVFLAEVFDLVFVEGGVFGYVFDVGEVEWFVFGVGDG